MDAFRSDYVTCEERGEVAIIWLDRTAKRNAVCEAFIDDVDRYVAGLGDDSEVRVLILAARGDHFCAGLDLEESKVMSPFESVQLSNKWYDVLNRLEFGRRPVVSVAHGAVIGGGLELLTATHIRVADTTAHYLLPEGRRGIFVGGGASVRVGRIIGADRLREMMLTGRRLGAEEGRTLGLSHYLVEAGRGVEKALELARVVAGNADLSNYMIMNAVPRIADMSRADGLYTEAISAALTLTSPDALRGMEAFLGKSDIRF